MDNNQFFIQNPEVFQFHLNRSETDFYIHIMGYHNFHFISPLPYIRKQPRFTVHFILSGCGYLVVNGKKHLVRAHEVFFLDNKTDFAYYPSKDEPWEYVFFETVGKFAPEYINQTGLTIRNPIKTCRQPQKITSLLVSTLQKKEKFGYISYFDTLSCFFALLDSIAEPENNREYFYGSSFVEEIKNFIQMKYLSPEFNLEYLCSSMHISHSHLCRIFKKSENISLINYINRLKMTRAEELLLTTNFTITEISYMSGYREYEYFLRLFKRVHGISPTKYRQTYQK